jgi:nicotinate dehydrogenase subunit B
MKKKYKNFVDEELDPDNQDIQFNRREFLKSTGAGVFVFFTMGDLEGALQRRGDREYPEDYNAYLRIAEDGRVTCFSGKIEMGQGIITSLAQMLAEELDVSLNSVDMVMGDTKLCPYDSSTTGSRSTKYFGPALRSAAAEARAVLIEIAAENLGVPKEQLVVENGIVKGERGGKKISYGALAKGKRINRHINNVQIKSYSTHTVSGKATAKTDALPKVTGEAKFAGDIRLPEMLYAKILRPPAHEATLKKLDVSEAEKIDGVIIVQEENLIAALHPNPEEAEKALNKFSAEFELPNENLTNQNIFNYFEKSTPPGNVVTERGNLEQGKKQATKIIDSTFYNHYVAHAPMEPHTVLVDIVKDEIKVWASTQSPFPVQRLVAETLEVPIERVHVITPFVGGGFGGKKAGLDIIQAAQLAKITGKPVQIALSRKEEFFYDTFRPAALIKLNSGINTSGKITHWDYDNYFAGSRSSEPIYDIPHYRVYSRSGRDMQVFDTGAWRGPGSNTNVFAMESQTDILAQAAGMDPLSFRLENLTDQRMIRVLKAAVDKFGQPFSKGPSGKGFGIACTNYLNSYVVTIAEVKVDVDSGNVQPVRIVCAQDMGEIINPQGARLQIEGGITMGLGYALKEEIFFNGKRILTENFDDYEITRFSIAPQIDAVLVNNPELAPQGCGEPAITTTGAVMANAIYDACGARLYSLPMTPERIKKALKQS